GGATTNGSGGATTNGSGGSTSTFATSGSGGSSSGGGEGGAKNDCGNATLDPGEDCDDTLLGTATCTSLGQGFTGGTLACAADCTFDTSGCTALPTCGNGAIDAGESCDGSNLGGKTCASQGFGTGTLACSAGCAFDTSACHVCGNGTVDGPEMCDGPNLAGQTCATLGHDGGSLACAAGCLAFDESACSDCGDGTVSAPEQCDGANLSGQTCQSQGFSGGTLACSATCAFDFAGCTGQTCGNNVKEGTELCDGTALGGQTCQSQGFSGGTLACNGACSAFVTSGCTGSECSDTTDNDGDGFVDAADPGCTSTTDNDEAIYAANCMGIGGPIYDITFADTSQDIVVTGSTVGGTNGYFPTDLSDDCTTASGPEAVFFYRNSSYKSPVIISTDNPGTDFDTVLYIRQTSCDTSATELCNDDVFFIGGASELSVNLPIGDYFIIVDGYAGQAGNYELTIDLP
ncbi:MAG TPA: hypothetical protein VL400_04455, partial [Polyangiaceae bacterium]|nr:hypothetical protein [Polyangiaceae bacterium]